MKKIYKVTKLKTGRGYVLGTLQDAIEQFERYEKVTIDPYPPEMGEGDLIMILQHSGVERTIGLAQKTIKQA